jgi:thiamine-phosphate pyrophosphorylase
MKYRADLGEGRSEMRRFEDVRLYCFSPGKFLRGEDPVELVSAQIRGGADLIQLREKDLTKRQRLQLGVRLREVTRREGVLYIVNDDVDLALILDADGVHLGQEDIPIESARPLMRDKIIGVSTHSLEQVEGAVRGGADYIGVGPIFETGTKEDREDLVGVDFLLKVKNICPIPYVAIGGITKDNIDSLIGAGCRRAAVISDILRSGDIEKRCRLLKSRLQGKWTQLD